MVVRRNKYMVGYRKNRKQKTIDWVGYNLYLSRAIWIWLFMYQ
jgi:hypothetical protein